MFAKLASTWGGMGTTALLNSRSTSSSIPMVMGSAYRSMSSQWQLRNTREVLRDRRFYFLTLGLAGAIGWGVNILQHHPKVTESVYLDISIGGEPAGRIVIGLHGRQTRMASQNFIGLATHELGFGYRGCPIHQVIPGFAIFGGDVTKGDGSGGASIFGPTMFAEPHNMKHLRGTVSMVTSEEGDVRSQFFILTAATPDLKPKQVGFGTVLSGMELVDNISRLPLDENCRPLQPVTISTCGVLE